TLAGGDIADHCFGEPALRGRACHVRVGPAELVRAKTFKLVISGGGRHIVEPSGLVWCSPADEFCGTGSCGTCSCTTDAHVTCVVQIPSPWAMVARRRTGVPSSRPNASVSASHSCGNSAATCATGQWCWQICSPWPTTAAALVIPGVALPGAGAGPAAAA